MGKKKGHPAHENLERWVVSYADFMTLLFATFTAMFALAQAKLDQQEEQVMAGIRQGFESQSLISGIQSVIQGMSPPTETPNPMSPEMGAAGEGVMGDFKSLVPQKGVDADEQNPTGEEGLKIVLKQLLDEMADMQKQLKATAAEAEAKIAAAKAAASAGGQQAGNQQSGAGKGGLTNGDKTGNGQKGNNIGNGGNQSGELSAESKAKIELAVSDDPQGVRLRLNDKLLFTSGTATLKPEAKKALATLAASLKKYTQNSLLQVEGHTDNQPINSSQFPSNWELSGARASAVVRYLVKEQGFPRQRMSAAGFADIRPLATNKTVDGRATNRRIEFLLFTDPKDKPKPPPPKQNNPLPSTVVITPKVSPQQSSVEIPQNTGPEGQYAPKKSNRLTKQLVERKSTQQIVPQSGPARVILKRTDGAGNVINTQVMPAKPSLGQPIQSSHHNSH
jgi:chemotaxis protein MotB